MLWVDCVSRMPEKDGAYLTWDGRSSNVTPFFFGSWQANHFVAKNITHWMPLPKGPSSK